MSRYYGNDVCRRLAICRSSANAWCDFDPFAHGSRCTRSQTEPEPRHSLPCTTTAATQPINPCTVVVVGPSTSSAMEQILYTRRLHCWLIFFVSVCVFNQILTLTQSSNHHHHTDSTYAHHTCTFTPNTVPPPTHHTLCNGAIILQF